MASSKRTLKVFMCTDPMSSMQFDNDQGREYDDIERQLREAFSGCALTFARDIFPHQLTDDTCDIYLFDFGGMLPGCEDMIASHYRELIKQAPDHTNTVFLLFSSFSVRWYKDLMQDESGELGEQANVVFYDYDGEWITKARTWLGIS